MSMHRPSTTLIFILYLKDVSKELFSLSSLMFNRSVRTRLIHLSASVRFPASCSGPQGVEDKDGAEEPRRIAGEGGSARRRCLSF